VGGSDSVLATLPANTTKYTDTTAAAGTQYLYEVVATNAAGDSAPSNEASVTTPSTTQAVVGLTLINADTDQPITGFAPLQNGATLDLATLPTRNLNIRADTNPGTVGSVKFGYDGNPNYWTESTVPYALAGDTNAQGDYIAWTPTVGTHTLTATPYSGSGGTGTAGTPRTITFTVTDSSSTSPPGNTTPPPGDAPPTATLVSPSSSATVAAPGYFVVRADASDSDGTISKVEFYQGSTLIGVVTAAPYSVSWTDVTPGTYALTAKSYDNQGASTTSKPVTITVVTPSLGTTYVVDPSGNDSNPGTAASPVKTISRAAQLAMPGDTVLIKPGTYHESVNLSRSGTADRPITFRAETPGTVVIDGADPLTGWTRDASNPSIYSAPWNYDFMVGTSRTHGEGAASAPASVPYAEQVLANGSPMTQVLSFGELKAGTFYVDWDANRMYVWAPGGADPTTAQVVASTRQRLFGPSSPTTGQNIVVDGITFRHAANFSQNGAVETGTGWRLEDSIVEWTNGTGVTVSGDGVVLLRVTARDNGQSGISGSGGSNDLIKDSVSAQNNYKGYKVGWEAGGGKFSLTDGMYVVNYTAYENTGPGIWFDFDNSNFAVVGSTFYDNRNQDEGWEGVGIMTEINPGPVRFENNLAHDNQFAGIVLAESEHVSVIGNTLINNRLDLRDMTGREFSMSDVRITNNKFKNAPIHTSLGTWTTTAVADMKLVIDFNTYDDPNNTMLYDWTDAPEVLDTLDKVRRDLGFEKNGKMGSITG
jgi:parallel beta-helix repeat protein